AGRPADAPHVAQAWAWADLREVASVDGWLVVNGAKFCPDTGHVSPAELLAVAKLAPQAREARVRAWLRRWLRPAQVRRRVQVLRGRTRGVAVRNAVTLGGYAALSIYLGAEAAARVPERTSIAIVALLPWVLLGLVATHFAGVFAAWRAMKRLPTVAAHKRGMNLFTAALMPPQALRLRALVGEGFFPAQHPLAIILALATTAAKREAAFNVIADLRWPIGGADDPPLAREIAAWFRSALAAEIEPRLRAAGLAPELLLAPPVADSPAACAYCPRCQDQFTAGRTTCPHGITLQPIHPAEKPAPGISR
ncbi:MAG: hypothetical protein JNL39_17615, partial [Opitutaceae bacterium]|nr:hypothetical protein [Opitutaceae bacterium]